MEQSTTGKVVENSTVDNSNTVEPITAPAEKSTEVVNTTNNNDNNELKTNNVGEDSEGQELAKFAKGQGINNIEELTERERSLLKMARDNKSALDKSRQSSKKLDESSDSLSKIGDDSTDVQKLSAKIANIEFKEKKEAFFSNKDKNIEPEMAKIVEEKQKQFGDDYARALLGDLDTLYQLAISSKNNTSKIVEQAKQEERETMNKNLSAGASDAHAIDSKPSAKINVTKDWIINSYDSSNPEHRALVEAVFQNK